MSKIFAGLGALLSAVLFALPAAAQPSQSHTPGPFDRVFISGMARVELSQSDRDVLTVMGDADVQRAIHVHHERSSLHVSTDGDWKFWNREPVVLRLQMREIRQLVISGLTDITASRPIRTDELRINISGRGDVRLHELVADRLRFEISGAGGGEVNGRVDDLVLRVSGAGKFNAENLKAARASVIISGAANTDLWVTDELRVNVSGVGAVNYWGSPKVRQDASAMAKVNARGDKRP